MPGTLLILSTLILLYKWETEAKLHRKWMLDLNSELWDFPGGPVAKTRCSQCKEPGSIPGQGTRSHMLQLKILNAATKPKYNQINKYICLNVFKNIWTLSNVHSIIPTMPLIQPWNPF